ncbi:hypothetical protein CsSME_00026029 [Camellia sinensis var. sinensis]
MASMVVRRANSSSVRSRWTYDVFLSFRGKDTRDNFISHLYAALALKGIHTFKDDEKLERGKEISPKLRKTIRESRFSIAVCPRTVLLPDCAWMNLWRYLIAATQLFVRYSIK